MGPVLVTGAGGLLGREVARVLGGRAVALGHDSLDVADAGAVRSAFASVRPAAVVHCAALTDVDACEREPERAHAVNAEGSANIAAAAAELDAYVVAVSTDYVFDGTKGSPYTEDDEPNPIQHYGRSKLAGERALAPARHAVVRSAWIYGKGGKNFLSRLFEFAREGHLAAVNDQTGSPTYAPDLAAAIAGLVGAEARGVFHVTNEGACTFAEFCRYALELSGIEAEMKELSWRDLGRPAERPANTSLTGARWRSAGFDSLRGWREAAADFVRSVS